jgi:hypothetical protein
MKKQDSSIFVYLVVHKFGIDNVANVVPKFESHYFRLYVVGGWTMHKRSKVAVMVATAVIIAGAGVFYLVSPLFISTQVNEPLPTSVLQSESYQRFISMNEEDMQAAKQMSSQERDTIMTVAARINNSIDESMDQTLVQQQQPQNITALTNTTPNILRTGSFVGAGDGIHNAEGMAKNNSTTRWKQYPKIGKSTSYQWT